MNVPPNIALVVSSGLASMAELSTVLGSRDLYNLIEVILVNQHNAFVSRPKDR